MEEVVLEETEKLKVSPEPSLEENEPEPDGGDALDDVLVKRQKKSWRKWLSSFVGAVLPPLTLRGGKQKLSFKKSSLVVIILYLSHSFSAWGDRMWGFAVSLLLVLLYPGSLLLPGIHGFVVQLTVAIFGTIVGDYVDYNSRIKVAVLSLMIQNGLLVLCSVVIAIMFHFDLNVCLHMLIFVFLVVLVMLLASGANLATVANTISIEKDWIVVIADGNENSLAVLNSNMRRIDLICKLVAPVLTGIILQYSDAFTTTIVIAVWNSVSFFVELGLLWIVYKLIPTLAVKKLRKSANDQQDISEDVRLEASSEDTAPLVSDDDEENLAEETHDKVDKVSPRLKKASTAKKHLRRYCSFFFTFIDGWKIYIRQEVALVGFALAAIYLTVLGFSGVTSSYLLTQGLRKDFIGVAQGVGAIFGVTGTVLYPILRNRFGTIRTGLFGFSIQLSLLSLCVVSVFVPSARVNSESSGYYSPNCDIYFNQTTDFSSTTLPLPSTSLIQPTPTCSIAPTQTIGDYNASPTLSPTPSPFPCLPEDSSEVATFPTTPAPSSLNSTYGVSISLYLLVAGVVVCRVGLWMFDLAVQQLLQEKVIEEERGVVNGVMNAMISVMDMLHYVLVIVAPRPENFNILIIISFLMVAFGWLLYSIYVRKARGHYFHFMDFARKVKYRKLKVNSDNMD